MAAYYPVIFGVAMFLAWNAISIPVGIVSGFQEARGRKLGRRVSVALEIVNAAAEVAVLIAITLKLVHSTSGNALGDVAMAYGMLIALEFIALKAMKLSTSEVWPRSLAVMLAAASISILVG